ncbi:WecB/TagA/CpsF family glycosyltransferase [Motilimonas sp. KMU-193]|uniref:WecB/TagA/CpsF family glycosyltransferase n=1 Tax=Motilimonas sp. KMU-193 TaxID=3388668 RepID=UPI00396B2A8D
MKLNNLYLLDEKEIDRFVDEVLHTESCKTLGFLNQHGYNLMLKSSRVSEAFADLDFLLRDGKGLELACRYWGLNPGANLNGTDFIPYLLERCIASKLNCNFFVYGTCSPWLEKGAKSLLKGENAILLDGFLDEIEYVKDYSSKYSKLNLNIVLLAMGMPKQEKVASLIKEVATAPTLIICGGAIIDFQAERFNRSPLFLRKIGMEWLYRLIIEPKRMFKRYVLGIPIFFFNVFNNQPGN